MFVMKLLLDIVGYGVLIVPCEVAKGLVTPARGDRANLREEKHTGTTV